MLVLYIFILMFTNSINHIQKNIHSTFINRITILTLLLSLLYSYNTLYFQQIGKGLSIYSGLFQITVQSQIIEIILIAVGISILLAWPHLLALPSIYPKISTNPSLPLGYHPLPSPFGKGSSREKENQWLGQDQRASLARFWLSSPCLKKSEDKEKGASAAVAFINTGPLGREESVIATPSDQYSLIAIFSILGGSLLMSSLDLLSMYLSIELQSFALYILATLNKERLSSTSAGLKYFLLGSLSSCFILLGSAIIYSYTGLTQFESLNSLLSVFPVTHIGEVHTPPVIPEVSGAANIYVDGPEATLSPLGAVNEQSRLPSSPAFMQMGLEGNVTDITSPHIDAIGGVEDTLSRSGFSIFKKPEMREGFVEMLFNQLALPQPSLLYSGKEINAAFTIGLIVLIIGFLFKISAAPFYQWAPDVYDGTPTIVTVWLTIVVKLTITIFLLGLIEFTMPDAFNFNILRLSIPDLALFHNISQQESPLLSFIPTLPSPLSLSLINPSWRGSVIEGEEAALYIKNLLLISSLLSLLIGTIAGLSQIKFKRLLAFSSISHVGFLLLALGIYSQNSIDAFLFYLIQYSFTSLNIFLILLAFSYFIIISTLPISNENIQTRHLGSPTDINYLIELKEQLFKNPILSISMAICLFSMAGVPPLIGFFSKQFVLFSSIENGNNLLSIVAILVSVISASYYLKIIKITFFSVGEESNDYLPKNKTGSPKNTVPRGGVYVSKTHCYIIAWLTFLILFFFLDPSIILNGTQLISLTIFNI